MKKLLSIFILLSIPYQTMADLAKYTYDCQSDARYYMNDGGEIQHQIVKVGKLGYPDGTLSGLVDFEHQLDGVTYYFSAQAFHGSYTDTNEELFQIDFNRYYATNHIANSVSLDIFDLNNLPKDIGVSLVNFVPLPNGGWVNFTLRCKLVAPQN